MIREKDYMEEAVDILQTGGMDYRFKLSRIKTDKDKDRLGKIEDIIAEHKGIDKGIVLISDRNGHDELILAVVPHIKKVNEAPYKTKFIYILDNGITEAKKEAVRVFLVHLLNEIDAGNISVVKDMQPLCEIWRKKISGTKEISINKSLVDMYSLKNAMPLFSDILVGNKSAAELLKSPRFNPEYLALDRLGVNVFLNKIFDVVNKNNKKNRIGIIYARTGKLIEILEKKTKGQEYILFDSSPEMLESAKKRDTKYNTYRYSAVKHGCVEHKYLESCDYVIAVNTLHQLKNGMDGLKLSNMMMKANGKLIIINHVKEDIMSLVSSYVLRLQNAEKQLECKENSLQFPQMDQLAQILSLSGFQIKTHEVSALDNIGCIEAVKKSGDISNIDDCIYSEVKNNLPDEVSMGKCAYFINFPLNNDGKADKEEILSGIKFHQDKEDD